MTTGRQALSSVPSSHALLKDADFAAVEINNSCRQKSCPYCANTTLPTQCPSRITMGINTWPGGLAPFMVAPVENTIPVPRNTLSLLSGTLIDPFAPALHTIDSSLFKNQIMSQFWVHIQITALVREGNLQHVSLAKSFGADHIVSVPKSVEGEESALAHLEFDVVFDTTGNQKDCTSPFL
ncbi:hypothetical protein BJ741DRAFT_448171 [Chytriomyces cf. hyalinus JEL632]|nr:hypothetical protein BJ741DRAFT_448171 [Chytriomyces cf. hyalinus JEL632]